MEAVVSGADRNPNAEFWRDRRVLVTGHTGFKGAWLALWLRKFGARVTGIALPPTTTPNLFHLASIDDTTETHFQRHPGIRRARRHDPRGQARDRAAPRGAVAGARRLPGPGRNLRRQHHGHRPCARRASRHARRARRGHRDHRQGLQERCGHRAVSRRRPARRARSLQRQQGRQRNRRVELSGRLSRRAGSRRCHGARRQRHRRWRLVRQTG